VCIHCANLSAAACNLRELQAQQAEVTAWFLQRRPKVK
jgi:hypothetical protein